MNTKSYIQFITDLKKNIIQSRYQATRLANREQLFLYYRTGKMLKEKVEKEKWGTKALNQISTDLQKQLPGIRGFSSRNLHYMRQFFEAYEGFVIVPSTTAKFEEFLGISFTHHISIINKCSNLDERIYYIQRAATELWSVTVLEHKIDSRLFQKQGTLPNNFSKSITENLKSSPAQIFNDEYLMEYMNLGDEDSERDIEDKIVLNIRNFILRMGIGFSFIGNQFRLELEGEEFFIDLLFYNRYLKCLVAFELKRGKFKPEYAGQINFYLNVLDDKIRLQEEKKQGKGKGKGKENTEDNGLVKKNRTRNPGKGMGV